MISENSKISILRKAILRRAAAVFLALMLALMPAAAFAANTTGSDTTTVGAQEGESEEDLERRKEVYTMVALITAGAIIVGIRNKKGRR